MPYPSAERIVSITAGAVALEGALASPPDSRAVVLFAHGTGSGRRSSRNNFVAGVLREAGLSTLLFDLLTEEEDASRAARFDIALLTGRLLAATRWVETEFPTCATHVGYFGASTGAAAALRAAAASEPKIGAVVSRGGRPDLALEVLDRVSAPTLLIVGGWDEGVLELNRMALEQLTGEKQLVVVPRATHLFEEPGALETVARLASDWFARHLMPPPPSNR
jgi:dienelactone hydrolase